MGWFSKVGSFIKNNAHAILDVAGMISGAVADLANVLPGTHWYLQIKNMYPLVK